MLTTGQRLWSISCRRLQSPRKQSSSKWVVMTSYLRSKTSKPSSRTMKSCKPGAPHCTRRTRRAVRTAWIRRPCWFHRRIIRRINSQWWTNMRTWRSRRRMCSSWLQLSKLCGRTTMRSINSSKLRRKSLSARWRSSRHLRSKKLTFLTQRKALVHKSPSLTTRITTTLS